MADSEADLHDAVFIGTRPVLIVAFLKRGFPTGRGCVGGWNPGEFAIYGHKVAGG